MTDRNWALREGFERGVAQAAERVEIVANQPRNADMKHALIELARDIRRIGFRP